MKDVNSNYAFTIKNYVKPIIEEVYDFRPDTLYISNVCVDNGYRGKKIGTKLRGYFIKQMEKVGYNQFALDCLLHNLRAKNSYHGFMFGEIKQIIGFDGTDHSKVEVVSMLRKKLLIYQKNSNRSKKNEYKPSFFFYFFEKSVDYNLIIC